MLKERFLRLEYERICASGQFVYSAWRENAAIFMADVWEMTPNYKGSRYFSPIDPSLGYAPDYLEIRYQGSPRGLGQKTKRRKEQRSAKVAATVGRPKKVATDKRKAADQEAKAARRRKLAEEFRRWDEQQAERRRKR